MIRRRDIRRAVVQLLKDANIPGIGANVFPSRSRKIWPQETGLLLVYTQEDDADDRDTAPVIYQVQTSVVIRAVLQEPEEQDEDFEDRDNDAQEEELEAKLDELSDAVVRTMHQVHGSEGPLGGLVEWLRWKGTRPFLSADGEVPRNSRQILFSATWSAELPDQLPEDDFLRAGTELQPPASANAGDLSASFVITTRTP